MQTLTLILALVMTAVGLGISGRRVLFLYRVITSGQPAPDRVQNVTKRLGTAIKTELVEVFGQRKLLKWTVPGAAHFFVFWAFVILATVYLEAYIAIFKFDQSIPFGIGEWRVLGFLQDFIAMMAVISIVVFTYIRMKNAPKKLGRWSRFSGSHLGGAYFVLLMIFNVVWSMFLYRGAASQYEMNGHRAYENGGAFISNGVGNLLSGLSQGTLGALMVVGLLLHIGIMLVFLVDVLHSKHLHIFVAPINVIFGRRPVALGAAKPLMSEGKPLTLEDVEELDEDTVLGVGKVEDFSWKGILDFATCTECGRCQSQCPAWNTEKPLSPKLLIMALRDSAMHKGPYLIADEGKRTALLEKDEHLAKEVERPIVADTGDEWFYMPEDYSAVIDPDVLWSCVTCGACVNQCPVDIEHVDHIIDMRRYQVLVESNFPTELNGLFKGMESKGNPWNMSPTMRLDWAKDLPFELKVVGDSVETLDEVEWLFWVGCAGAYEDRAKKTTRAVAELLDMAGVSFAVLGNGETCNGDSARRAGNEFLFQQLAQQNIETFKERKVKKVVSTCAHCFNTLKNEYSQFGIELEVVHHTQLLNRLVREKKLTPVASTGGTRAITYHDPCYLGRHNQVYSPPRELLQVLPGTEFREMPRNSEKSFCCGAGGARMWMEETIGQRINTNRTKEAVATGADQIAVGCPFCRVMLSDGLTAEQAEGNAREEVEVLDVAQLLLASIKGEEPKKKAASAKAATGGEGGSGTGTAVAAGAAGAAVAGAAVAGTAAVAESKAAQPAQSGGSLFDMGGDSSGTSTAPSDATAAAPAQGSGGSLFDLGGDSGSAATAAPAGQAAPAAEAAPAAGTKSEDAFAGGSLFDMGGASADSTTAPASEAKAQEAPSTDGGGTSGAAAAGAAFAGGSLFDLGGDSGAGQQPAAEPQAAAPQSTEPPSTEPSATGTATTAPLATSSEPAAAQPTASTGAGHTPASQIPEGGSLFDLAAPAADTPAAAASATPAPAPAEPPAPAPVSDRPASAQAAAPTTGGGHTPASQIPEGGSLFDLAAPAEVPSNQAPPHEAPSNEAPTQPSTTADGGQPAEEPKPASSGEAHSPKTDTDLGGLGSLFDL